jgi:hypothetical protein
MSAVRRTLAGLLFALAFACWSVAVSGWWLQRTLLSPDRAASAAARVLADEPVRAEFVRLIADATANQMYPGDFTAESTVRAKIDTVAQIDDGAALFAETIRDAHRRMIGDLDTTVQIPTATVVQIVRDEHAGNLPPVTIPVEPIGALRRIDSILGWLVPITAIAGAVLMVLCILARPERAPFVRAFGIGLGLLAALTLLFGYVVPTFVPPLLTDDVWARIPPQVAAATWPSTLLIAALLAGVGGIAFASAGRLAPRRRWSTPVSTYRYKEERSWS